MSTDCSNLVSKCSVANTEKPSSQTSSDSKLKHISGMIDVILYSYTLQDLILYIWYNPWVLFILYNFGLW